MGACGTDRPALRDGRGHAEAPRDALSELVLAALLALCVGGTGPARAGTTLEWRGEASATGIFGDPDQVTPLCLSLMLVLATS